MEPNDTYYSIMGRYFKAVKARCVYIPHLTVHRRRFQYFVNSRDIRFIRLTGT